MAFFCLFWFCQSGFASQLSQSLLGPSITQILLQFFGFGCCCKSVRSYLPALGTTSGTEKRREEMWREKKRGCVQLQGQWWPEFRRVIPQWGLRRIKRHIYFPWVGFLINGKLLWRRIENTVYACQGLATATI